MLKAEPPGNVVVVLVYNLKFVMSPAINVPPAVNEMLFSVALEVLTFALKLDNILFAEDLVTFPADV